MHTYIHTHIHTCIHAYMHQGGQLICNVKLMFPKKVALGTTPQKSLSVKIDRKLSVFY